MYFNSSSEFIEAIYYAYYSTYDLSTKKDIMNGIYEDYLDFGNKDNEFEEIYRELYSYNFTPKIDDNFIRQHNGKILSIKQLLHKKVKIHYLETSKYAKKFILVEENNCKKCGNKNKKDFFTYNNDFKQDCVYCKKCIDFGFSNNIHYNFHIDKNLKNNYENLELPKITLSPQQELASETLIKNCERNKNTLIWAVCGAGKTEIIYKLIYKSLKENKKICLAIPRKDVIIELYKRIRKDFKININILHGSEKQITDSLLYIMTTHQLVNYYNFFDVLIVDEVDAFPYYGDDVLEYSSLNSRKNNCPVVFLSATPSKKIKNFVDEICKIPIRYHQKLLPVPKIIIDKKENSNLNINPVLNFIKEVKNKKRRALIFVPSIKMGENLYNKLKNEVKKISFVSSVDSERENKIQAMYNYDIDILITTTILERGVTFDYLDVFVYFANHKHFTKEALIQIAGRVGRKYYDYNGEVIFYAKENSKNIKSAIKEISYMNELAKYRKLVN